jgi:transcription elongation regulator 1
VAAPGAKGRRGAEVRQIDAGKDAAIEAEMKAARERAVVPQELRVQQFMEMLAEKEVRNLFEKETVKLFLKFRQSTRSILIYIF